MSSSPFHIYLLNSFYHYIKENENLELNERDKKEWISKTYNL